jgi:hypothetical protein
MIYRINVVLSILSVLLRYRPALIPVSAVSPTCPDQNEPCMTTGNWAKCQALIVDGCTNILTLESCPLQFACGEPIVDPDDPNGLCPSIDDRCILQEQYDECIALVKAGCTDIFIAKSCPAQVRCSSATYLCPAIDGNCVLREQYDKCIELVKYGCSNITIAESCPVQVGCNSTIDNDECPPIDGNCVLQEQYDECKDVVNAGCINIEILESCPVQFRCKSQFSFLSQIEMNMFRLMQNWFASMIGNLFG